MKYYFFYLEVRKLDIRSDGVIETTNDNAGEIYDGIKQNAVKEAAFVYGKVITEDDVIIKQFNKL